MGEIRAGMTAQVTVEAYPDRNFVGTVEKVEPQAVVQQNVTMFPVIVHLDNRSGLLKPGMNAEVEILINQASDVLLVPNGAVVQVEDVGPAAMALGLSVDQLDLAQFRSAGRLTGGSTAGSGDGPAGADGSSARPTAGDDGVGERGAAPAGRAGFQAFRDSVQARVEAGEIDQDSARVLFRARMAAAGPAPFGANGESTPGIQGERQVRNAVVFVVDSAGVPSPMLVRIGLNDWDYTQVLSGLEQGDQLAVVGAAQLQAQQQEFMNRIRERRGGGPF
jgi:HlyD family secretion protein